MDYRRFGDTLLVRIDRGEEILEQVKTVALKENIQLASVRRVQGRREEVLRQFVRGQL